MASADRITTIAGIAGAVGFVVDGVIQSGLISPDIAPLVKAGQGLALAVVGYYVGKPVRIRA